MKIADFGAQSDLVGRRIVVSWNFVLERGETLAVIPRVTVRRKLRDFEFMPLTANDATIVYDSTAFPPAGTVLTEIPGWEVQEGELRRVTIVESAAQLFQGQAVEVRRRTVTTTFDLNHQVLAQHIELLDTGAVPGELFPGTTYYYQITSPVVAATENPAVYRATVTATDSYSLARKFYELIPSVYRRHDVRTRPITPGAETIPEAASRSGQLRRFVDVFGATLDQLRSSAEGLRDLHDIGTVDYRFLPLLARWIGWDLNLDTTIPVQRNEIKSASVLYKQTGTIPNLRALVNYYTGWFSQIAEFAQSIARSNQPPQFNLFALQQTATGWRSPDDAALILGWTAANATAVGSATDPATLTNSLSEPFALRPGMKLGLAIDGGLPIMIQFGAGDFADIAHATAAEVSHVLNQCLESAAAIALGDGHLQLQTYRRGGNASLEIRATNPELITLESAPLGKLSPILDANGSLRLFYDTMETDPDLLPTPLPPNWAQRRIRYKTYHQGVWGESHPIAGFPTSNPAATHQAQTNQANPAAAALATGEVFLAWIEPPDTATAQILTAIASPRSAVPAVLVGTISEPFNLRVGGRITFRRDRVNSQTIAFLASDFVAPEAATATEVATALNARMVGLQAIVQSDRSLKIVTTSPFADSLEIDLRQSDIARELGFGFRNSVATGSWDDTLDWNSPQVVSTIAAGRHADLHGLVDRAGGRWLFWAQHDGAFWQIMTTNGNGTTWTNPIALTSDAAHHRQPHAILDGSDRIWLIWSESQPGTPNQDRWLLRRRVFDPTTTTWSAVEAVTSAASEQVSDRQPAIVLGKDGNLRIFFHSDRGGSLDLWTVEIRRSDGVATAPQALTQTGDIEMAPAPIWLPDGQLWLLYRSEQSIALTQSGNQLPIQPAKASAVPMTSRSGDRSIRLADTGTLRHFHGSTSLRPDDLRRNRSLHRWDDRMTYTPQKVATIGKTGALVGEQFYTPNTFGIYISRTLRDTPLTQRKIERLRQVLERAIPVNMRAVIILAPRVDLEYVYESGTLNDLQETYRDDYPWIESYTGLLDRTGVQLPDWIVLLSNTIAHRSADPTNLTSLRLKSFFPPFE